MTRSGDRRRAIATHLGDLGLAFSFFDAVDGQVSPFPPGLDPSPRTYVGKPFKAGELATAASYRELCADIAAGPDDFVCILEDDARLDARTLPFLVDDALVRLPRFDVLRLGHGGLRRKHGYVAVGAIGGEAVVAPVMHRTLAHAQVVTLEGARRMADGLVALRGPVDWQLFEYSAIPLRILQTARSLAEQASIPSAVRLPGETGPKPSYAVRSAAKRRSRKHFRAAWGTWMYIRARTVGPWAPGTSPQSGA